MDREWYEQQLIQFSMSRKIKYNLIIAVVFGILMFSRCYYDSKEYLFPELISQCDTTSISYTKTVQPVLTQYCLSCHSNNTASSFGANIRLENHSDVLSYAQNGKLLGSVIHDAGFSPMPKGSSKLDECSINGIRAWIESGSPNN